MTRGRYCVNVKIVIRILLLQQKHTGNLAGFQFYFPNDVSISPLQLHSRHISVCKNVFACKGADSTKASNMLPVQGNELQTIIDKFVQFTQIYMQHKSIMDIIIAICILDFNIIVLWNVKLSCLKMRHARVPNVM